ncbi:hypothetical protein A3B18_02115 [Candidatus Giovannonibacteria bacterium RIFCSPLOWO2_01_FULL_46_13]|uniref:HTH cro/C1-type domain-containing protein n=1 Tax=Candidatus Giovannonibacteria bacterium RIFCSPLOWO2_01_FULL_46_13 TaxID=1798352 RepID=A0A1F5X4Q7_9BACT|nr:MAG: hypothetical protein A3B18_02115 [Candidatus Giovannonibacteria bacterium RIFCSPLOWO2_01_FULL_46_13]
MPRKRFGLKDSVDADLISRLIAEGLRKTGKTQAEACDETGIHRSHLSKVLRKKKSLGRNNLLSLARVLEIPLEKIFEAANIENDIMNMSLSEIVSTWKSFERYGIHRTHLARFRNDRDFAMAVSQTIRLLCKDK